MTSLLSPLGAIWSRGGAGGRTSGGGGAQEKELEEEDELVEQEDELEEENELVEQGTSLRRRTSSWSRGTSLRRRKRKLGSRSPNMTSMFLFSTSEGGSDDSIAYEAGEGVDDEKEDGREGGRTRPRTEKEDGGVLGVPFKHFFFVVMSMTETYNKKQKMGLKGTPRVAGRGRR